MIQINLLSWRELARKKRQKNFRWLLVISIIFSILLIAITHFSMIYHIKKIHTRIHDKQEKLLKIMAQSQIVKQLNQENMKLHHILKLLNHVEYNQIQTLKLLEAMLNRIPSDVSFTEIIRQGQQTLFKGHAKTALALSQFEKNFSQSDGLQHIQLIDMNQSLANQYQFKVQVNQKIHPLIEGDNKND